MKDIGFGLETQRYWDLRRGSLLTPKCRTERSKRKDYEEPLCRFLGDVLDCDLRLFVNPLSVLDAYDASGRYIVELKSSEHVFEDVLESLEHTSNGAVIQKHEYKALAECCAKLGYGRGLYCYLDKIGKVYIIDSNIIGLRSLPERLPAKCCDKPHFMVKIGWWDELLGSPFVLNEAWTRTGRIS